MPWGRVDDQHYRHEKVGELDEDLRKGCIALFWLTISWCNDRLTDGRVPAGTVRILGGDDAEAAELVRVGLWEQDGKAYRVHDFLDFNKSKAQVESERVQRTLAGQAGAKARWRPANDFANDPANDSPSDIVGEPDGGSDAPVSRIPSPVTPSPDPRAARESLPAEDGRDDLEAFMLITRKAPTPRQRALLDGLLDRHDLTGPKWAADIMLRHPDDPIGAVIEADKAWRAERIAEAQAAEKPKPQPRRSPGMPTHSRELLEHWAAQKRAEQEAAKEPIDVR